MEKAKPFSKDTTAQELADQFSQRELKQAFDVIDFERGMNQRVQARYDEDYYNPNAGFEAHRAYKMGEILDEQWSKIRQAYHIKTGRYP